MRSFFAFSRLNKQITSTISMSFVPRSSAWLSNGMGCRFLVSLLLSLRESILYFHADRAHSHSSWEGSDPSGVCQENGFTSQCWRYVRFSGGKMEKHWRMVWNVEGKNYLAFLLVPTSQFQAQLNQSLRDCLSGKHDCLSEALTKLTCCWGTAW